MGPHSQIKAPEAALFKAERAHRSLGVLVIIHIQFNNSWSLLKKKTICSFISWRWGRGCTYVNGGQGASLSTVISLLLYLVGSEGMELGAWNLTVNAFTHRAISPAPKNQKFSTSPCWCCPLGNHTQGTKQRSDNS